MVVRVGGEGVWERDAGGAEGWGLTSGKAGILDGFASGRGLCILGQEINLIPRAVGSC